METQSERKDLPDAKAKRFPASQVNIGHDVSLCGVGISLSTSELE